MQLIQKPLLPGMGKDPMQNALNQLVRNMDYAIRMHNAKVVGVFSDRFGEGKSTLITATAPLLAQIYKKNILVLDLSDSPKESMRKDFGSRSSGTSEILKTRVPGLDYVARKDLFFLNIADEEEKERRLKKYVSELEKFYDLILVNTNTFRRVEKTELPKIPMDGAFLIRTKKTIGLKKKKKTITTELNDRGIPVLGLISNEGY